MENSHIEKGDSAERTAEHFLSQEGCECIARNFSCRYGEIDLICTNKRELVFVEVRYRSAKNFGTAAETVNIRKQQKIIKTAQHFLMKHSKYRHHFMRFDVIGINADRKIDWIKGAFLASA